MSLRSLKLITTITAAATLGAITTAYAGSYAGNPYSPTYRSPHARHGVVPTVETWKQMHDWTAFNPDVAAATGPNTLSFGGGIDGIGVTSGIPKVYLVVYGSQWGTAGSDANGNLTLSKDTKGLVPRVQQLFGGLSTGEREAGRAP